MALLYTKRRNKNRLRPFDSQMLAACAVLACAGFITYAGLCWLFDISRIRGRLKTGLALFRTKFASSNG